MKKLFLPVIFGIGIFCNSSLAQWKPLQLKTSELAGVWQADDSLLTSGWEDAYCFFKDGEFEFHINENNSLRTILSLKGLYRVSHDTLFTQISSRTELVGGNVVRGNPETVGEWQIVGYTIKVIKQPSKWEYVFIGSCAIDENSLRCISLGGRTYYKISGDPNYYK